MKIACWLAVSFCLLLQSASVWSWTEHSSSDEHIQVWLNKDHPNAHTYTLVRTETVIAAPLTKLLPLLQDAEQQHQWLPYTHRVTILSKPQPKETLVHFQTQSQWPFKPRDALTLFRVNQPQADIVTIEMLNRPQQRKEEPGYIRLQQAEGSWQLTALPNCKTHVRYQSGSRWGGAIPQWLVNKMNRTLAVEALSNLRQWAPQHYGDYQKYDYLDPVPLHQDCP